MNLPNVNFLLPMKVYITHYSSRETSLPFKKLCNICSSNESFADQLLDHQKIDLAAYAEMLNLTAPIIISDKKHFKGSCSSIKLSELMNVSEEAFALLLMENCFSQWKWIAEAKFKAHTNSTNTPSCSTSSTTISSTDDHSKSNTGPTPNSPSKSVQCSATPQIQSPLSQESACYNIIVQKVIAEHKVRQDFEEHLIYHFKEKQKKEPLILKKRKHKWSISYGN